MTLMRVLAIVRLGVFVLGAAYLGLQWDVTRPATAHSGPSSSRRISSWAPCCSSWCTGGDCAAGGSRRRASSWTWCSPPALRVHVLVRAGQPLRSLFYLVILEAALLFRTRGGVLTALATVPILAVSSVWREEQFDARPVRLGDPGRSSGCCSEASPAAWSTWSAVRRRPPSSEPPRRSASGTRSGAASTSWRPPTAVPVRSRRPCGSTRPSRRSSTRCGVRGVRSAGGRARETVCRRLATAGLGADRWPPGPAHQLAGVVQAVIERRSDARPRRHGGRPAARGGAARRPRAAIPRSRPPAAGDRTIGYFALARREPEAFGPEEVELITLLGRLVGSAVQNIRAYEAERATVEELRRLSALRADFVSLVSHELRSPMAAVIGSARTLQQRWRELRPEQREAFLAVIGDETSRLASLIEDVLHTSRIEAGTFTYRFAEVDLVQLARDSVAAAGLAQDEVKLAIDAAARAAVRQRRLRAAAPAARQPRLERGQVLGRWTGGAGQWSAARTDVSDCRPGRGAGHRARAPVSDLREVRTRRRRERQAGHRLGLFIARSIATAHGGSLDVHSALGRGATFTLTLPV